jgi:hypothetical protein
MDYRVRMPRLFVALLALSPMLFGSPALSQNGNGNAGGQGNGNGSEQGGRAGEGDGNANSQAEEGENGQGTNQGTGEGDANSSGDPQPDSGEGGGATGVAGETDSPDVADETSTDAELATEAAQGGRALPLRDVVGRAMADYPGELVDAKLREVEGVLVYELKILSSDGRRLETVFYDAKSGLEVRR